MAEQPSQPQLTLEELKNSAWYVPQHRSDGWRAYRLALFVLRRFLGQEWIDSAFTHVAGNVCGFLNPGRFSHSDQDFSFHIHRVIDLAEDLFNLQYVEGFYSPLDQLKKGNIEATVAELEVASMLSRLGVVFRFVLPLGKRGENYDLEIAFSDGRVALADTKCKLESTPFGEATISDTLSKTPNQFPPDKPSIVFLKVPQTWLSIEHGGKLIGEPLKRAAHRFLGATTRVVSVKYFFRYLIRTPRGLVFSPYKYMEITNIRSPLADSGSWDLLRPASPDVFDEIEAGLQKVGAQPGKWVFLGDVCDETDLSKMYPAVIERTFLPE
jgi:hypothetical protein